MSRMAMQFAPGHGATPTEHLLRFAVVIGLFYQLFRLAPRAFLAHAFCAHWRRLIHLLYQPESDCLSACVASRESIPRPQQDFVRLPMRAVDHLIDAALPAECTGKKIVSGIDAFHRTSSLNLPPVEVGRVRGDSAELDSSLTVSVARADRIIASKAAAFSRRFVGAARRAVKEQCLLVAWLALDHRTIVILALIVRVLISSRPAQIRFLRVLAVFLQLVFHDQGQPLLGLLEL